MPETRHRAAAHGEEPVRAARPGAADVPEADVRMALVTRRHGLPALVHDRRDGRRARRARRRLDVGLHVALPLLPQPGHVGDDQRHSGEHRAGHGGAAQVPSRSEGHVGRVHAERRRAADAASLRHQAAGRGEWHGHPYRARHQRLLRRQAVRRGARVDRSRPAGSQGVGSANGIASSPAWTWRRRTRSRSGWRRRRKPVWVRYVLVPG